MISVAITASMLFSFSSVQAWTGYTFTQVDSFNPSVRSIQGVAVNDTKIWVTETGSNGATGTMKLYWKSSQSYIKSIDTYNELGWPNANTHYDGNIYVISMCKGNYANKDWSGSEVGVWGADNDTFWASYDLDESDGAECLDYYNDSWYVCYHNYSTIRRYSSDFSSCLKTYDIVGCGGVEGTNNGYQGIVFWEEGTNGTFCGLSIHSGPADEGKLYVFSYESDTFSKQEDVSGINTDSKAFNQGWDTDEQYNISYVWIADRIDTDTVYKASCNAEWVESEETPCQVNIVSINGQQNNSVLQDNNRTFKWNIVPNATNYSLRISNHSDFHAEVFLQLDNISLAEWGATYYSEASGNVTFILPNQYNITTYVYHYYQVRSYST